MRGKAVRPHARSRPRTSGEENLSDCHTGSRARASCGETRSNSRIRSRARATCDENLSDSRTGPRPGTAGGNNRSDSRTGSQPGTSGGNNLSNSRTGSRVLARGGANLSDCRTGLAAEKTCPTVGQVSGERARQAASACGIALASPWHRPCKLTAGVRRGAPRGECSRGARGWEPSCGGAPSSQLPILYGPPRSRARWYARRAWSRSR